MDAAAADGGLGAGFGQRHLAWRISAGFTQNFGNQLSGGHETTGEVADKAAAWPRQNGTSDNWFCHVNFWDVHTPYKTGEPYRERDRAGGGPGVPNAGHVRSAPTAGSPHHRRSRARRRSPFHAEGELSKALPQEGPKTA